ncbi:MAG: tryptophan synthase subunit alpha, partial [Alphaproteobacteria bacterium]|nr:tryptophan synthase subunit alpha [Alphaproteobacteria bacterium]
GPAIQAAGERALKSKTTMPGILDTIRHFRHDDDKTPIILMGYINPILRYGPEKFAKDASTAGADGLILVDLPHEEQQGLDEIFAKNKLDLIQLISPATTGKRLATLAKAARGFIYYVSIAGITGTASASAESIKAAVAEIRKSSKLPVAAGFGIRDASQVKELNGIADGIVVGSALVNEVARLSPGPIPTHAPVFQRCKSLSDALRG